MERPARRRRGRRTIARDLHALLTNAGERPPFVLVGHSVGGLYVVTYTTTFPSEVAGLVLVESTHPEQVQRFKALVPALFTGRRCRTA